MQAQLGGRASAILVLAALHLGFAAWSQEPHSPDRRLPQLSGGLKGYIAMNVPRPPQAYRYGVSFYSSVWSLVDEPLSSFQIGLPSTWIIPDNTDFEKPLCPPGTVARDNWPERGPTYRDVFQTIEGGLGYWASTQFGSTTPKYRMNGTPDGYNHEISSPGWGFGGTEALGDDVMGLAQLSNRLLVPPDGLTFKRGASGELLGNAWMSLPLTARHGSPGTAPSPGNTITGDQSWTLFLSSANFRGPVAFWVPETWSRLSRSYPTILGRGLDARPALMSGGAMEVNTVPYFEGVDERGTVYSRIPRLRFPVDRRGETVLMQDVRMYSAEALSEPVRLWRDGGPASTGRFRRSAEWAPACTTSPLELRQGPRDTPLQGLGGVVETKILDSAGKGAFGLRWKGSGGLLPEYYKQVDGRRVAVAESEVPEETLLKRQVFAPAGRGRAFTSPSGSGTCWSTPGPRRGPFTARLSDGSVVAYSWYRFIDQPALQRVGWSDAERRRLQSLVERLHARWPITGEYLPRPSHGSLVSLDPALIVTPPRGLGAGYVPIVTRQAAWPGKPLGS